MVTEADVLTGVVVTENLADVAFASTVTLAGTWAAALLPDKVTCTPPVGAAPFKVTVPVDELPPTTLVGLMLTEASHGLMVKVAVRVVPL